METADYYWQGASGQLDILARSKPIHEVIGESPDAALRQRLARVQEIRAFASRELGLPDNASYTKYADLGRPFVVWNVFAAPELSLTPRQWCFPIAGCVSYRGYFSESEARAEAARLQAAGDDVWVSGVPAYSTLGYFDDPVLSTFVRWPDVEVARMVFHELAHQVVYVKDDTQFNESFAVAVEEAGVERWLLLQGNAQLDAQYLRSGRLRAVFRDLTRETRADLARIYASDAPDAVKRSAQGGGLRGDEGRLRAREGRRARARRIRALVRGRGQRRPQQCEHRVRRALFAPGAGVSRAAGGGRRGPPEVLRAREGNRSAAQGRTRRGARGRRGGGAAAFRACGRVIGRRLPRLHTAALRARKNNLLI